jgi:phage gp29-like protein
MLRPKKPVHGKVKRRARATTKVRTNGSNMVDPRSTMRVPTSSFLQRRTTRAVQFNWILPMIGAVTPQYLEMILRGALAGNHIQQYQLFELMIDTWPELAAAIQELTYGVTRREIIFDPYTEEDEQPTANAIERTKLVSAVLRNMDPMVEQDENGLEGTVRDLMDGWFRGVVVCEVMWQTGEVGKVGTVTGPRATAWVQPQTYGFNQQGILGYNTAQPTFDTSVSMYSAPSQMQLEPFPPDKFLIGIHKVKSGTPLGGPMLRALAWWWCAVNFSSDWLLNLAQVFGLPFRWASYPASAPDETVNAICDMLANMGSAGWGAFPVGTTLELKDPTRAAGESPQEHLLDRADRYVRSLILGQTMSGHTMLTSGRGGQAFGTVEAQLKQDRLQAASDFVADIFNEQLIPSILRLNYGDEEEAPICRFLQENEGTYQDAQRDQILVNIGVPIPLSHMRKKYSIPEPEGDEEVLTPPVQTPLPGAKAGMPIPSPETAEKEQSLEDKAAQGQPVSEQQQNRAEEQKKITTRLEKLTKISDDELFGRELKRLSVELVSPKSKEDQQPAHQMKE